MEPASKVSVPLTVVKRIMFNTPDNVTFPADCIVIVVPATVEIIPAITQIFPETFVIVKFPEQTIAAWSEPKIKPAVLEDALTAVQTLLYADTYPVDVGDPPVPI